MNYITRILEDLESPSPVPDDWRERLASIVTGLCDGLAGLPIYALAPDELAAAGFPAAVDPAADWRGITSRDLHWRIKPYLERAAKWAGPGPAFGIHIDNFRDRWESCIATGLHEFAHCLQYAANGAFAWSDVPPLPEAARLKYLGPLQPGEDQRPAHGAEFIRLCLHISHRYRTRIRDRGDVPYRIPLLFDPTHYELPPLSDWSAALGTEPEQLCDYSLFEVATLPFPERYQRFADEQQR